MGAYTDVITDLEEKVGNLVNALKKVQHLIEEGGYIDEWDDEAISIIEEAIADAEATEECVRLQDEAVPSPGKSSEEVADATPPGWRGFCTDEERQVQDRD